MQTSSGVIVTNGPLVLLGHSTNNLHWDIPKGKVDEGEENIEAAKRELFEETGIEVNLNNLEHIALMEYLPKKNLDLYLYKLKNLPDLSTIVCHSMVEGENPFPEMDKFQYVEWEQAYRMVIPKMSNCLMKAKNLIDNKNNYFYNKL